MKNFSFTAILQQDLTGEQVERLSEVFEGDAASGVRAGVPHVHFDLDASSLDEAIHKALAWILEEGVLLEHIELSSDSLRRLQAARCHDDIRRVFGSAQYVYASAHRTNADAESCRATHLERAAPEFLLEDPYHPRTHVLPFGWVDLLAEKGHRRRTASVRRPERGSRRDLHAVLYRVNLHAAEPRPLHLFLELLLVP